MSGTRVWCGDESHPACARVHARGVCCAAARSARAQCADCALASGCDGKRAPAQRQQRSTCNRRSAAACSPTPNRSRS